MMRILRSGIVAAALFCGAQVVLPHRAEAHSRFYFSANIGVPVYAGGYYGPGWFEGPAYYPRPYYRPYYYAPRPIYYPRPHYYRPYYRPIASLGLFPAYIDSALTPDDREVYFVAYRRALAAPVGESMVWNSGTVNGTVTTTRDGWAGERYCREFRQEVTIAGERQQAYGTACQAPNGDWQIVPNQ